MCPNFNEGDYANFPGDENPLKNTDVMTTSFDGMTATEPPNVGAVDFSQVQYSVPLETLDQHDENPEWEHVDTISGVDHVNPRQWPPITDGLLDVPEPHINLEGAVHAVLKRSLEKISVRQVLANQSLSRTFTIPAGGPFLLIAPDDNRTRVFFACINGSAFIGSKDDVLGGQGFFLISAGNWNTLELFHQGEIWLAVSGAPFQFSYVVERNEEK